VADNETALSRGATPVYRICRAILGGAARLLFRPTVVGAQNIPLEGPVIVAPIHRSNVDFVFTIFVSPRKVYFMAKEGIFRSPAFARLLRELGAFKVERGSTDRDAMRLSEEALRHGLALIIFPEGTREEGRDVNELHDGAMFVAARTGARVVPVGIAGSDRAMPVGAWIPRPSKVVIVVGEPLDPPALGPDGRARRSAVRAASEELRARLQATYHEALERRGAP
jgi:1-acyl-sn-glycerol-3-phosphate acyltransferase